MNQSIISTRYAKALMMAGKAHQCLDELKADMELIGAVTRENTVFRRLLDIPVVMPSQKRKIVAKMFDTRVHSLTLRFIGLLICNRREILMTDIARNFLAQYEKSKGLQRVHIISAADMDGKSAQQLQMQLSDLLKTRIQLTAKTNPNLISGFILRVGDRKYDTSLSSVLGKICHALNCG